MKQLPRFIEKRLPQLSSSKDIFYWIAPYYEQRLGSCRYNEKLTYQQQGENNKTLGKFENAMLYGLTHPTRNHWRQTLVNTFLDSSKKIFHQITNFEKTLKKTF